MTHTSESSWPTRKEAFELGLTLGYLQATHKMQQQPPMSGGGRMTLRGVADLIKSLVGYFTAAHKLVLLWRAISFGYIGRELLRWLGWL